MDVLFAPLAIFGLLLFGPFIALNAYLLVWLCGPAIRRAGRCWEEGRVKAESHETRVIKLEPMSKAWCAEQPTDTQDSALPTDKQSPKQATTERDAGHRWLG